MQHDLENLLFIVGLSMMNMENRGKMAHPNTKSHQGNGIIVSIKEFRVSRSELLWTKAIFL